MRLNQRLTKLEARHGSVCPECGNRPREIVFVIGKGYESAPQESERCSTCGRSGLPVSEANGRDRLQVEWITRRRQEGGAE